MIYQYNGEVAATAPPPPPTFRPPWWLRPAHAQTIGGKLLRPTPGLELRRERLDTPDGDFLDLDIAGGAPPHSPPVLVLHGLEGSALRQYMLLTYSALLRQGFQPVGLNFRSCSGEPNRLPRFYHSGETDDLRVVLAYLAERFPRVRGAIGFSLGGNMLLKYLGEEGEKAKNRLDAAVAVSVPFDLATGADTLEKGLMARIYTNYFLRSLRGKLQAKREILQDRIDLEAALRARTLREFDDAATAPLHGFASAAEYYRLSSSAPYLEAIRVPTLLIQAEDDPFFPAPALPRAAMERNPYIVPRLSRHGGHVGFIAGALHAPRFYAEETAAHFLANTRMAGADPR
jgi:predicted alpha/beta-fold hydrolase